MPNTNFPEPVSSEITVASSADVVAAKDVSLLDVYATVPPDPKETVDASVAFKVNVLLTVKVFPLAIVNVADVAGAVIVNLLIEVALATPNVGVTNVGEVLSTTDPDPVDVVVPVPPLFTAMVVAFHVPDVTKPSVVIFVDPGNVFARYVFSTLSLFKLVKLASI